MQFLRYQCIIIFEEYTIIILTKRSIKWVNSINGGLQFEDSALSNKRDNDENDMRNCSI